MMAHRNWVSSVIIYGPDDKVPLVKSERKPSPHYWKLPGGRSEPGEMPEETAAREIMEEVGLVITDLKLLTEVDRGSHDLYLYEARVLSFDGRKRRGDEGETIALFSVLEMGHMVDFLPSHREVLKSCGVV